MRIVRSSILAALAAALVGCGLRTLRTPAQMIADRPPAPPVSLRPAAPRAWPTTQPAQHRPLPLQPTSAPVSPPDDAPRAARTEATEHPAPDGFINAVQVYNYTPGVVYEVITTPGFVTAIRLRPGEQLRDAAAGDTARWLVEVVAAGVTDEPTPDADHALSPSAPQRTIVLVKPRRPLIRTNVVITTNERTYLLDLRSVETDAYHSMVEWTYPAGALSIPVVDPPLPTAPASDATHRTYAYVVKVPDGAPPVWTPTTVYHDGQHVTIAFDGRVAAAQRPPLFVVGPHNELQLVNYHVADDCYIVDQLFDRAELRLGEARVRIEHVRVAQAGLLGGLWHLLAEGD